MDVCGCVSVKVFLWVLLFFFLINFVSNKLLPVLESMMCSFHNIKR